MKGQIKDKIVELGKTLRNKFPFLLPSDYKKVKDTKYYTVNQLLFTINISQIEKLLGSRKEYKTLFGKIRTDQPLTKEDFEVFREFVKEIESLKDALDIVSFDISQLKDKLYPNKEYLSQLISFLSEKLDYREDLRNTFDELKSELFQSREVSKELLQKIYTTLEKIHRSDFDKIYEEFNTLSRKYDLIVSEKTTERLNQVVAGKSILNWLKNYSKSFIQNASYGTYLKQGVSALAWDLDPRLGLALELGFSLFGDKVFSLLGKGLGKIGKVLVGTRLGSKVLTKFPTTSARSVLPRVITKSTLGKGILTKLGSKAFPVVAGGLSLYDFYKDYKQASKKDKGDILGITIDTLSSSRGGVSGYLSSTLKWATLGSAIGSILPGIGTLLGGLVGAGVGLTTKLASSTYHKFKHNKLYTDFLKSSFSLIPGVGFLGLVKGFYDRFFHKHSSNNELQKYISREYQSTLYYLKGELPVNYYEKEFKATNEYLKSKIVSYSSGITLQDLLNRQIYVESKGNPYAVSKVGAKGLAQFMPSTWRHIWKNKEFFAKYNENLLKYEGIPSIYDSRAQRDAQKAYMKYLLSQFNNDPRWALVAYNWGLRRAKVYYAKYDGDFSKVLPKLPKETKTYVKKILPEELLSREKVSVIQQEKKVQNFSQSTPQQVVINSTSSTESGFIPDYDYILLSKMILGY